MRGTCEHCLWSAIPSGEIQAKELGFEDYFIKIRINQGKQECFLDEFKCLEYASLEQKILDTVQSIEYFNNRKKKIENKTFYLFNEIVKSSLSEISFTSQTKTEKES